MFFAVNDRPVSFIWRPHNSLLTVLKLTLEIKDLHVAVGGRQVLRGVSLTVRYGEVHAVMGPNGSGKSTLAYAIMGRPGYEVTKGDVLLDGESLKELTTEERSLKGLFLAMQEPPQIPGVRVSTFLIASINKRMGADDLTRVKNPLVLKRIYDAVKNVGLSKDHLTRELNVGFSGGEKKRNELLQLLLLDPKVVILDEPDSGLDVDGVKRVAEIIQELREKGKAVLLITHYPRILEYVEPNHVTVLYRGTVVAKGGPELAKRIEEEGYSFIK